MVMSRLEEEMMEVIKGEIVIKQYLDPFHNHWSLCEFYVSLKFLP